jgi:hypothetical protein
MGSISPSRPIILLEIQLLDLYQYLLQSLAIALGYLEMPLFSPLIFF